MTLLRVLWQYRAAFNDFVLNAVRQFDARLDSELFPDCGKVVLRPQREEKLTQEAS